MCIPGSGRRDDGFAGETAALLKAWGTPSQVRKLNNGTEELLFHVDDLIGDVCFLVRDGKVVAGGTGI